MPILFSKAKSPLHGLRFHDFRHHAMTELAESRASERTIMAIAGHISPRMLEHYSHIRFDAKRKAPRSPRREGLEGGYGTNHGTNPPSERMPTSQIIEKNGGDDGTRTRGL